MPKVRDRSGKLTDWIRGRRIIWIEVPATPLPTSTPIGPFEALLYYREQKQMTCRWCLGIGHKTENCINEEGCLKCIKPGHHMADGNSKGIMEEKQRHNGPPDKLRGGPLEERKKYIGENSTEKEREDGEVVSEVEEEEVERIEGVDTSKDEMENVLEKRQSSVKAADYLRRRPTKVNTEDEREGEVASEVEGKEAGMVVSYNMSRKEMEDEEAPNSEEEDSNDHTHNAVASQEKGEESSTTVKIALKERTVERRLDTTKTAEKQRVREKSSEKKDQNTLKEFMVMKRNKKKYEEGETGRAKAEDRGRNKESTEHGDQKLLQSWLFSFSLYIPFSIARCATPN
ncbi:hypothetical protein ElyMa_004303600 [Elysia marginata]|uniref:Zinc knuckle CX2CX4HX4C domain-containing protein n=1 Tax=Elysia marginata TaxID=1093978 RepID=A0AAV4GYB9_9GAST|nr:hypothetical protein ElyMa_004303600 [Elysia marginata]